MAWVTSELVFPFASWAPSLELWIFLAQRPLWGPRSVWPEALDMASLESQICPCHRHTHNTQPSGHVSLSKPKNRLCSGRLAFLIHLDLGAHLPPLSQPNSPNSLRLSHTHTDSHTNIHMRTPSRRATGFSAST